MNRFKRSASRVWQQVGVALGVSAMVVVVGCGDDSGLGQRYKVTGHVNYNGKPVPKGTINFIPTQPPPPQGRAATGEIKDGYYSLSTAGGNDGALPGEYGVTIQALDVDLSSAISKDALPNIHQGDPAHQKAMKSAKSLVPTKYNLAETSKLTAKVDGAKEINFDLTD